MILFRDKARERPRLWPGQAGCFCCAGESPAVPYYYTAPEVSTPCCEGTFPRTLTGTVYISTSTCPNMGGPHTFSMAWGAGSIVYPACGSTNAINEDGWKGTFTSSDGKTFNVSLYCILGFSEYVFRVVLEATGSDIWCRAPHQVIIPQTSSAAWCNSPVFIRSQTPAQYNTILYSCFSLSICGGVKASWCGSPVTDAVITIDITE